MTGLGAVPRNRLTKILAIVLAVLVVVGAAIAVRNIFFGPKTITAYFPTATAIYPGDDEHGQYDRQYLREPVARHCT
jgi:phospholipid/cholesterol/gamma-HCH transport system substrate-binding protein